MRDTDDMLPRLRAPYILLHDFLPPEEREALLAWTLASETRFNTRNIEDAAANSVRKHTLDDLGPSAAVFSRRIHAEYAAWIQQLKVSAFELGRTELRIGAYNDGDRFSFHLDANYRTPGPETSRMLSAVYYYYRAPRGFSGGDIRLFDVGAGPGSEACEAIAPAQNMLLVFPSWVGHDVTRIGCPTRQFEDSRFAVNCWLHKAL